jgi:hypothetical protein
MAKKQAASYGTESASRAANGGGAETLSCVIEFQLTPVGAAFARSQFAGIPGLNLDHSNASRMRVAHAPGFTRVDLDGQTLFGRRLTFLRELEKPPILVSHEGKYFFEPDHNQHPRSSRARPRRIARRETRTEESVKAMTLIVEAQTSLELSLEYEQEPVRTPLAEDLILFLVGKIDGDEWEEGAIDELVRLGVPSVYKVRRSGSGELLVRASMSEVELRQFSLGDFQISSGYRRAKDVAKALSRPQGRRASSPTVRLSDIRPQGGGGLGVRDNTSAGGDQPPPQDTSFGQTEDINVPQCLPATYTSQLALDIEQQLLTDLQFIVNSVARRLDRFDGVNGQVVVNWLEQWGNTPAVQNGEDGLFYFLNDTSQPPHNGLLARLAERQARVALAQQNLTGLPIDPALLFDITSTFGLLPDQRFDSMPEASRTKLRDIILNKRLGKFSFNYPTSSKATTIFFDLIEIKLSDIAFHVQLNDPGKAFYDRPPLITKLQVDKTVDGLGKVHAIVSLEIDLRDVTATATVAHWPSLVYAAAWGVGIFLAGIVPGIAELGAPLVAATIFFGLDIADLRVELENASVNATIAMTPDKNGLLKPTVSDLTIDADVTTYYMSDIPDVVHQIVSMVYMFAADEFDVTIGIIRDQLKDALNSLFDDTLALRFPPPFGTLQTYGWGGSVEDGSSLSWLYLQSGLNAGASGGLSPPFITQVSPDLEAELMKSKPSDPSARLYAGFVLSQNFINQFVNARWRAGDFNYQFTDPDIQSILAMLGSAKKDSKPPRGLLHGHVWPAVTPRTVLTPNSRPFPLPPPFNEPAPYAMTFFDDLRLCLGIRADNGPGQLEIKFSAYAFTQFGFGGINPDTKEIDFMRFADSEFDLYFDLDHRDIQLITPEIQDLTIVGLGFDGLNRSSLSALQPLLAFALRTALASRSDRAIPNDGFNRLEQRYKFPAGSLGVTLRPTRGNVFGWLSLMRPVQDDKAAGALLPTLFLVNLLPPPGIFDVGTLMMAEPGGQSTINDIQGNSAKTMLTVI